MELRLPLGTEAELWAWVLTLALTYLAHSVVWTAAVALLTRSNQLSAATRHACWKAALFGPLVSAWLATVDWAGWTHRLLDGSSWNDIATAALRTSVTAGAASEPVARFVGHMAATYLPAGRTLALLGLLTISVGLLRFFVSAYLVQRNLRGRTLVTDSALLARFERLRERMNLGQVRLTESHTLSSPLVIGVREVCLPHRLSTELSGADMDAVLAHELAHVERKDGLWFPLVAAVQSGLWLQPLNHVASSYFRHSAELACDDRAVELTGSPLGLARALVHVAQSAAHSRQPSFVPTMVRHQSALVPRVRRLTNEPRLPEPRARAHGRWPALLKLFAIGACLVTLSVRVADARPELPVSGDRGPASTIAASSPTPPDSAEQTARMAALASRERAIIAELAAVEGRPRAREAGTPDHVRALELTQELRHVRGTQAWLEERFVEEWTAFESRSTPRR